MLKFSENETPELTQNSQALGLYGFPAAGQLSNIPSHVTLSTSAPRNCRALPMTIST
jgi:hypothetical protein